MPRHTTAGSPRQSIALGPLRGFHHSLMTHSALGRRLGWWGFKQCPIWPVSPMPKAFALDSPEQIASLTLHQLLQIGTCGFMPFPRELYLPTHLLKRPNSKVGLGSFCSLCTYTVPPMHLLHHKHWGGGITVNVQCVSWFGVVSPGIWKKFSQVHCRGTGEPHAF